MRVLLDEQLNHRHRFDFSPWIQVSTVAYQGWKGTKNGALLNLAEQHFDAFVTMDRSIEFQQNRRTTKLIIVVVSAPTNRYRDVKPLIPLVEQSLSTAQSGQLLRVSSFHKE
jgi:hypothetical protein